MTTDIAVRLNAVRSHIGQAARAAARGVDDVHLIAVSKTHDAEAVAAAIAAGQRDFGENRVQEAQGKFPALLAAHADVRLHLIGPLQTNKVRDAVALFHVIHSVDRPKLAAALGAEFARTGRRPDCLVQVNVGAEPQKAGVLPQDAEAFIAACRTTWQLPLTGLMCIPPVDADPAPHFAALAALAARHNLSQLSMGMSGDYEAAIAQGATMVRVGTAIFGSRPPVVNA